MSKSIRRFLSLLLVLQLIIPYSTFAAAVGEFSSVVGKVTQTRAKEVLTPVVKSPIELKDLIVTTRTSSATMVFSDNSTIRLDQNSKLEIKEFLFKEKSRTGIFSLAVGKLTANVKKYIGGENVFEVRSPTAVAGVRGTGFEFIEATSIESQPMATVSCTEGSLNLSALSPTGAVISTAVLEAGQMAVIVGGLITISKIAAAMAAGAASSSGAGTGGTAAAATAATAGTAAAATGISTAAIAGISVAGLAAVVGTAAAISGGGGGGGTTTPTTPSSPYPAIGEISGSYSLTATMTSAPCGSYQSTINNSSIPISTTGNNVSVQSTATAVGGYNSSSGSYSGSGSNGSVTETISGTFSKSGSNITLTGNLNFQTSTCNVTYSAVYTKTSSTGSVTVSW